MDSSSREVSRSDAVPSAKPKAEAEDPSRTDKDLQMPGPVWLAELGRPDTRRIYSNMNNSLDVRESSIGVGVRLKWWFTETELALYDSPFSHCADWLEICPIVKGRAQLTNVHALKGKGLHHTCPLGVAPGSMLQQLLTEDTASKKQE